MFNEYFKYGSQYSPPQAEKTIYIGVKTYETLLIATIKKLDRINPIYTLSGGIDSSLIFSYLDKPECFCVQVDGNDDYEYAKRLNPDVIKIEFNNVDIEKSLFEIQKLWDKPHCMFSDLYDYFVYTQFPKRLIIVGEEPRYLNGLDWTQVTRRLFFLFRYKKVDSPYIYNSNLYRKEIILDLVKKQLPDFISKRKKRDYPGPNYTWREKHKEQIIYLKKKYNIKEKDFYKMWRLLNLEIWRQIHDN